MLSRWISFTWLRQEIAEVFHSMNNIASPLYRTMTWIIFQSQARYGSHKYVASLCAEKACVSCKISVAIKIDWFVFRIFFISVTKARITIVLLVFCMDGSLLTVGKVRLVIGWEINCLVFHHWTIKSRNFIPALVEVIWSIWPQEREPM